MRTFSREHSYDAPSSALLALWQDPEFLAAAGARFGGVGTPTVEDAGERVRVRSERQLPLDKVPSLVRRFVGSGTLQQVDDWPRADPSAAPSQDPGTIEGTWEVSGRMPATMSGRQSIVPEGPGCRVSVEGTISVSAPLVSGKAEEMVAREITKLIAAQQEFAAEWLAGRRPEQSSA
jgi:uncharacterized protein DUF2505